jgi:excisionase family DNA binding protein
MQKKYVGYGKAAEHFDIKIASLYALVHERRIPHIRLGKRLVRFCLEDLEAWFNEHRVEAKETATPILRAAYKRGVR